MRQHVPLAGYDALGLLVKPEWARKQMEAETPAMPDAQTVIGAGAASAMLIAKVYEVDPLVCARCGFVMKLIAIITDLPEVRKMLRRLARIGRAPAGLDASSLN